MVFLITGASHTGKTYIAQKMLEKYNYPYLSIDHLKMGLIRSNKINVNIFDDSEVTTHLWPIIREIIKTAIENNQNLIIEGCYIPCNYKESFNEQYLKFIKFTAIIFDENYIKNNYNEIINNANVIENRISYNYCIENVIDDNKEMYTNCKKYNCNYVLIDKDYEINEILNSLNY